jgi:hypothetical protein
LRRLLRDLHFFHDKVAFFDLPGLEFDTETKGLLAIRGATLHLSTLTLVAHGVEVGVKVSPDIELAIQVDRVKVSLFRNIEIDDVYASVKGGEWDMTFGALDEEPRDSDDDAFMVTDTPILRAATMALDGTAPTPWRSKAGSMKSRTSEDSSSPSAVFSSVKKVSPDDEAASKIYDEMVKEIEESSLSYTTLEGLKEALLGDEQAYALDFNNPNDVRAAIATHMQDHPSVAHPPSKSIRLSTLKKTSHPNLKKFLHRLPLLYRLLLNPISYFHPVTVKSVTAAGSGKWFKYLMRQYFFKHYGTQDPDVRRLEARISRWLSDANFAVEMTDLDCTAQVPVNTKYDIECRFKIRDVMAYRTLPGAVDLAQVVRVGGADATVTLPAYLLPHHEHIFPSKPTDEDVSMKEVEVDELEDTPLGVQARTALDQLKKDEANMHISVHAHLPAKFHQDLLNFVAATVKATKVIENDKDFEELKNLRELRRASMSSDKMGSASAPMTPDTASDAISIASGVSGTSTASVNTNLESAAGIDFRLDSPSSMSSTSNLAHPEGTKTFKHLLRKVDTGLKQAGVNMQDKMRKAGLSTASAMANDRWIAKLVGKVVRKLEKAQGEVGYSANIAIGLEEYRRKFELESKILP